MINAVVLVAGLVGVIPGGATKVDTSSVRVGDSSVSFLARPGGSDKIRRPALLLAPEWWGVNAYAKRRAVELAGEGYVVLAVDLYGKGKVAADRAGAQALAGAYYGDPGRFRVAMGSAFAALKARTDVDSTRIGALGFCFGGTAVLEAARSGLPIKAVASFHGGVKPFSATAPGAVKGRVLVLHGGADKAVPLEAVTEFVRDMESSGADYGLEVFPHALHAFTNPESGTDPSKGVAYDERAEKASFASFHRLLAETGLRP